MWPDSPAPRTDTRFEHLVPDQLPALGRRLIAISADGRRIVYQTRRGIFVRSMDEVLTGATVSLLQDVQLPVGIFSAGVNYDVSNDGTLVHRRDRWYG